MIDDFETMQEYVDAMQSTSKTSEKEAILYDYRGVSFVTDCVYYTLHPDYKYGVTKKQVEKYWFAKINATELDVCAPYKHLFGLLDDLRNRVITGHEAIEYIIDFAWRYKDYHELILNIIDKDIGTRANATLVNKVWGKGFIPQFKVALAQSWEPDKVDYSEGWYASRKLDGLRCICKVDSEGTPRFYSRTGKEFETLGILGDNVIDAGIKNVVYDGELCIMKDGIEDFKQISKEYNKKNHTIANPIFKVFDLLTHEEFNAGESSRKLCSRIGSFVDAGGANPDSFEAVPQVSVKSDEEVISMLDSAERQGWEGLILRKNCGYVGNRSKDVLKVKKFKDAEFIVESIESGKMRFIENGKDVERVTMTKANIRYKGNLVGVGSGWSKEERARFHEDATRIIGKKITVQYKQESTDSDGKVSLQFPTVKAIHVGGRKV